MSSSDVNLLLFTRWRHLDNTRCLRSSRNHVQRVFVSHVIIRSTYPSWRQEGSGWGDSASRPSHIFLASPSGETSLELASGFAATWKKFAETKFTQRVRDSNYHGYLHLVGDEFLWCSRIHHEPSPQPRSGLRSRCRDHVGTNLCRVGL